MAGNHLFINGKIFTSDPQNPWAEAMLVRGGQILWAGRREDMPYAEGTVTDFRGRTVIPGFVDAHMHPVMLADSRKQIVIMPPLIRSLHDLAQAIRRRRREQGPGLWIEGWGYDEQALKEKRPPSRYDLDAGCSDAPVSITRTCAHICCVNSMALRLAGIDRNTPDPPGGEIERDENGEPTGILRENARNLITPFIPAVSRENQVENLLELGELLASQGITAICDMGSLDGSDSMPVYEEAVRRGFGQRIGIYYMWDFYAEHPEDLHGLEGRTDRRGQIFTAGLKLIGDGSVSGRTAWMDRPYQNSADDCGFPVCSDAQLESAIAFCRSHGCQLSVHAMGTRAITRVVDRAAKERAWTEAGIPYVRVEHVTLPTEESMKRAAEHGIAFVTQPIFPYAESASYLYNLGAERFGECYPIKRMLENKVPLAFSTDAPATFWPVPSDPFPGLKAAVTRRAADSTDFGADQSVDIGTAVVLYTRGAAQAAGFAGSGMLRKGYRADFAVLNGDIFTIHPENIDRIQVMETYIGGAQVYRRQEG